MLHRHGRVRLAIKNARNRGNGTPRNKFTDENDTPFPSVNRFSSDVEPKVYLFKVTMQRHRHTEMIEQHAHGGSG